MTPNPETMKFVANKLLYPGKSIDFADDSLAGPSPLAKELFSFPFIKNVFIQSFTAGLGDMHSRIRGSEWRHGGSTGP